MIEDVSQALVDLVSHFSNASVDLFVFFWNSFVEDCDDSAFHIRLRRVYDYSTIVDSLLVALCASV